MTSLGELDMTLKCQSAQRQTIAALFHFILLCSGVFSMPTLCLELGRVGGSKTCKKLTLNKENTKSFVLSALLKAFPGTKPKQLP